MKIGFYPKLAWTGIRKNKRMYTPYILTCIGMVMMYYMITFLSSLDLLNQMRGGSTVTSMLGFGSWVMTIFAVIFLFYTNSFLIRRRKKEFGLYNILGMGKRNIAGILFWETLMIAVIALVIGTGAGIAFSKLAELGLMNMIRGQIAYNLSLSFTVIGKTVLIFGGIFLLIFLNTLRQIHTANPVELLHSENSGEKPPKANWILGIGGVILLGAAYDTAVQIEDPIAALSWFFIAVIMVILGTYLLFVAGSVVFCRILQKKKGYYYKANHFVSVSSMAYRMKRNGAGLASICILGTMVLVMISSSACLYIGEEDSLRNRYPRNIIVEMEFAPGEKMEDTRLDIFREMIAQTAEKERIDASNILDYRMAYTMGTVQDGEIKTDEVSFSTLGGFGSGTCLIYVIPLEDYNHMTESSEVLETDEVLISTMNTQYEEENIAIQGSNTYRIKKTVDQFIGEGNASMSLVGTIFLVVPDLEAFIAPLVQLADYNGDSMIQLEWEYGFDCNGDEEAQKQLYTQLQDALTHLPAEQQDGVLRINCESVAANREDFYNTFGGLFFLGIMLSIVFIFAAVLIIYYKQISEGYEDQSRFEIMQKVGMTRKDIRRSINSQLLTVFFLPLVTAGIHLAFAFPMIRKLLLLFGFINGNLLIGTTIVSFLLFALLYTLVYRITSNAYYSIVSGVKST